MALPIMMGRSQVGAQKSYLGLNNTIQGHKGWGLSNTMGQKRINEAPILITFKDGALQTTTLMSHNCATRREQPSLCDAPPSGLMVTRTRTPHNSQRWSHSAPLGLKSPQEPHVHLTFLLISVR